MFGFLGLDLGAEVRQNLLALLPLRFQDEKLLEIREAELIEDEELVQVVPRIEVCSETDDVVRRDDLVEVHA
jgi:hypothetical protein